MKRAAIKRSQKPIARRVRVRAINPKRAKKKHERNYKHVDKITALPCLACGVTGETVQSAHIVARGMGGCKGDYRDQVPMCDTHHKEFDAGPETWAARHPEINLRAIADALADTFDRGEEVHEPESVFLHWKLGEGPGAALDW